jgi:uncharacterized protein
MEIAMILNLEDLFDGGESIAFDYGLVMSDLEMAPGEYPFREPVRVNGKVSNRAEVVTLVADAQFDYFTKCDRCLKEITEHRKMSFKNVLAREVAQGLDDDIIVCENETLDLDDLVITNIILDLSMKHLCGEDCKGLCPKCGENLNNGDCGCDKGYINPKFSQLKDLIK